LLVPKFGLNAVKVGFYLVVFDETPSLYIFPTLLHGREELCFRLDEPAYRLLDNPGAVATQRFGKFVDLSAEIFRDAG
jgi:hypothetical protein